MDKIKINDISTLSEIARQLKLPVTAVMRGITQEQASQIQNLSISESNVDILKHFTGLKQVRILGDSKSEVETLDIADLPSLESIEVLATQKIQTINMRNVPNVYFINVSGNRELQEVSGIEDIEGLMRLQMRSNKKLSKMFDLKKVASKGDIDKIVLDISTLHLMSGDMEQLEAIAQNPNMRNSINWLEQIGPNSTRLDFGDGLEIEKKAQEILSQITTPEMSDTEKICAINSWFVENVSYDTQASDTRDDVSEGKYSLSKVGVKINAKANTSYNSLVNGSAVCEGYTNGMKFLLNKAGIEAETVACKIWTPTEARSEYVSKEQADHSIIRFKTEDGWFYSDPTWDSDDKGKTSQYFFKTKEEMAQVHGLVDTERTVVSPKQRPQKYSDIISRKESREAEEKTTSSMDNEFFRTLNSMTNSVKEQVQSMKGFIDKQLEQGLFGQEEDTKKRDDKVERTDDDFIW